MCWTSQPAAPRSFTATAGRMVGNNLMINPGAWGNNVRLEVNYDTTDPVTLFNLSISEVDPSTGNILQSEVYRNLNLKSGDPAYAVDVVNNGSRIVFLTAPASPNLPSASGTLQRTIAGAPVPCIG